MSARSILALVIEPGTYAANCILARRLTERGVRFIQLFHRGWNQHNNLRKLIRGAFKRTSRRLRSFKI